MIDGECLTAFVAIAEERSFSRAADRLGIVQSVISKRLRRLEDQLQAELIDRRTRKNVRLTRIGEIFLSDARQTLAQLSKAEITGRNLARGCAGPIRIGFVFSAAMNGSLTLLLNHLHSSFPDIDIRPKMMDTPQQLAALDAGHIDLGLLRPRPSYPPECTARDLNFEPVRLALSARHPLASRVSVLARMLAGERFIVPQFHEQVGLIDNIHNLARAGGFDLPAILHTGDFVTAACLASAGEGVVLAPASLANMHIKDLVFREIQDFDEGLRTILVWRLDAPEAAIHSLSALAPE